MYICNMEKEKSKKHRESILISESALAKVMREVKKQNRSKHWILSEAIEKAFK